MKVGLSAGLGATVKAETPARTREKDKSSSFDSKSEPRDQSTLSTKREEDDRSFFGSMKSLANLSRSNRATQGAVGLYPGPDLKIAKEAKDAVTGVVNRLTDTISDWRDGMAKKNIDQTTAKNLELDQKRGEELSQMKDGSKKTFSAKGGGHIRGVGGEQEFVFEVERREDGKYVVSRSLGGGVLGKKEDGKASLSGKVKDEYVFDNPQDAAKAERILQDTTREGFKAEVRMDFPGEAELRRRDAEFLNANRSSISVTGTAAVEYAKKLGLPVKLDDKVNLGQLAGRGNAEVELKINYEKDPNGGASRAKELEINTSTGMEVDAEIQPGGSNEKVGEMFSKVPGAKTSGKLTANTTMPLPEGLTGGDLLENPARLSEHIREMSDKSKTKLIAQNSYELLGKSGRITTAEFEPTGDKEKDTEAVRRLLSGQPEGLRLGPGNLTVKSQTYEKTGTQYGGEIDLKVVGYEANFENSETQFSPSETWVEQMPVPLR